MDRVLNTCKQCEYQWFNHKGKSPLICPSCHTRLWDRERIYSQTRGPNDLIIQTLRKENPCLSLQAIGDKVGGISRERVRQILKRNDLKTKHWKQEYLCNYCGKPIKNPHNSGGNGTRLFCNRTCQYGYTHIKLNCDFCGKPIVKRTSDLIHGSHAFCNRSCRSKWVVVHRTYRPKKEVSNATT